MEGNNFGKKATVIVLHMMCMMLTVGSIYAMDYFRRERLFQFMGKSSFLTVIGLVGSFITLAYLTNICGYRSEEETEVHYGFIDKLQSDILILLFILFFLISWHSMRKIHHQEFSLPGVLVFSGTFTCIYDLIFLAFYLSIMRRLKGGILLTNSLTHHVYVYFQELFRTKGHPGDCTRKGKELRMIREALENIAAGALDTKLELENFHGAQLQMAAAINHIRDGLQQALQESVRNERLKAELITNVSHDIKTPLTSIVNYAGLLELENLENEVARNYVHIINEKSQRLRQLTEDLVEVSKITTGNVKLDMQTIDFVELLYQTGGEFNERFEARDLTIVTKLPRSSVLIHADGRQLYRAVENLYTNAAKYALEKSRVHVDLAVQENRAVFTMKNIAKEPIQANYNELTERFVRGESSRTMEGSGLGLSIAKNLTVLMGGTFEVRVEDDLFLVTMSFPLEG